MQQVKDGASYIGHLCKEDIEESMDLCESSSVSASGSSSVMSGEADMDTHDTVSKIPAAKRRKHSGSASYSTSY